MARKAPSDSTGHPVGFSVLSFAKCRPRGSRVRVQPTFERASQSIANSSGRCSCVQMFTLSSIAPCLFIRAASARLSWRKLPSWRAEFEPRPAKSGIALSISHIVGVSVQHSCKNVSMNSLACSFHMGIGSLLAGSNDFPAQNRRRARCTLQPLQ